MNIFNLDNFNGEISADEILAKHTSYAIGGPAKYFAKVNDINSLSSILSYCVRNKIAWEIIGGGTNILVSDDGFDGLIVKLGGDFKTINFDNDNNTCLCGAGIGTAKLVNEFKNKFYTGLEFMSGIPGTIGGACKMNAGRGEKSISDCIVQITSIDSSGKVQTKNKDEISWGYRFSSIDNNEIVLDVQFNYGIAKTDDEKQQVIDCLFNLSEKRKQSQPLNYHSCGSVFKNPENNFAAKLIEDAGLKALSYGGAEVSEKHANFIVNKDNAKAADVVALINIVQQKVYDKFNIKLIPELKFLGFDKNCSLF